MPTLSEQIAAIIDPPVWSGRAQTAWERKRDSARQSYSLKKAAAIIDAVGAHILQLAPKQDAVPDEGTPHD